MGAAVVVDEWDAIRPCCVMPVDLSIHESHVCVTESQATSPTSTTANARTRGRPHSRCHEDCKRQMQPHPHPAIVAVYGLGRGRGGQISKAGLAGAPRQL